MQIELFQTLEWKKKSYYLMKMQQCAVLAIKNCFYAAITEVNIIIYFDMSVNYHVTIKIKQCSCVIVHSLQNIGILLITRQRSTANLQIRKKPPDVSVIAIKVSKMSREEIIKINNITIINVGNKKTHGNSQCFIDRSN